MKNGTYCYRNYSVLLRESDRLQLSFNVTVSNSTTIRSLKKKFEITIGNNIRAIVKENKFRGSLAEFANNLEPHISDKSKDTASKKSYDALSSLHVKKKDRKNFVDHFDRNLGESFDKAYVEKGLSLRRTWETAE